MFFPVTTSGGNKTPLLLPPEVVIDLKEVTEEGAASPVMATHFNSGENSVIGPDFPGDSRK
jgi:hypothetical protein